MGEEVKEKKIAVKFEVKRDPDDGNSVGQKLIADAVIKSKAVEKPGVRGELISTNDHPEMVQYGDEKIRMSPRARQSIADIGKLSKQLPPGIHLKK